MAGNAQLPGTLAFFVRSREYRSEAGRFSLVIPVIWGDLVDR